MMEVVVLQRLVHFDVTKLSNIYRNDIFFRKTIEELNGNLFSNLLKKIERIFI